MNFDYTVITEKSFDEAVSAVEQETKNAGFNVLYVHNVTATLAEKGFRIEPFKIIEICNAKSAYAVLQADIKIGLLLPCKINVYQKTGKTLIKINPEFYRPSEVYNLLADPTKARKKLGWYPNYNFNQLISLMVKSDMTELKQKK